MTLDGAFAVRENRHSMMRSAVGLLTFIAAAAAGCSGGGDAPAASRPQPLKPQSKLVFTPNMTDLGVVEWPGHKTAKVSFKNEGDKPIHVTDVLASCGCTEPKLFIIKDDKVVRRSFGRGEVIGPLLTVEPAESGDLELTFDTHGFDPSVKDKLSIITIATDEDGVEAPRVFLNARVDRAFQLNPDHVIFSAMGAKQTQSQGTDVLVIDSSLQPPFQSKVVKCPEGMTVELLDDFQSGRGVIHATLKAGPGLPKPLFAGEVEIEASIPTPKRIIIPFHVPVMPDVLATPSLYHFQVVEAEKAAEAKPVVLQCLDPEKKLSLGAPVIEGQNADRLQLTIEPTPGKDGQEFKLTLRNERGFPAAGPNGIRGIVRIPTNLADFPEVRLEYVAFTRAAAAR